VYLQDINKMKKKKFVQVQDELSQRGHMVEACHPYGDHLYVKMRRRRSSPIVDYGGAIRNTSSSKHNQERLSALLRSILASSRSSGMHRINFCS
jgi:hypothetical protein